MLHAVAARPATTINRGFVTRRRKWRVSESRGRSGRRVIYRPGGRRRRRDGGDRALVRPSRPSWSLLSLTAVIRPLSASVAGRPLGAALSPTKQRTTACLPPVPARYFYPDFSVAVVSGNSARRGRRSHRSRRRGGPGKAPSGRGAVDVARHTRHVYIVDSTRRNTVADHSSRRLAPNVKKNNIFSVLMYAHTESGPCFCLLYTSPSPRD